ncbi:MAG: hypothetical protein J6A29_00820 [Clostridia bacterium]|nr:hypothetical protein [Clostridia bacterium]
MVQLENYPNAYKEVYEILKMVPHEDLAKIPKKFIEMVEERMNKDYNFFIDDNTDFVEEQELMLETRTILAYIFLNYWATEKQRETISTKFKKDIEEAENQKRELYNVDVLKNKKQEEKLEMVVYKKDNRITKILNKIKKFWGRK